MEKERELPRQRPTLRLCINVDGGMMLGAPGFVYRADQPET